MKVISGGQSGVDRAALDVAIDLGFDYGGSVPRGRRAEDGPIDGRYHKLSELRSASYRARTARNVADADATLIIAAGRLSGGTALTAKVASDRGKPHLVVDLGKEDMPGAAEVVAAWLMRVRPDVLNVAGPRESEAPGVYGAAYSLLRLVLSGGAAKAAGRSRPSPGLKGH